MRQESLLCFARGRDGAWEAICTDLDIAVTGSSLDEVTRLLQRAVDSYVEDAMRESPDTQKKLLSRRAPFWVEASLALRLALSAFRRRHEQEFEARFTIPRHA